MPVARSANGRAIPARNPRRVVRGERWRVKKGRVEDEVGRAKQAREREARGSPPGGWPKARQKVRGSEVRGANPWTRSER